MSVHRKRANFVHGCAFLCCKTNTLRSCWAVVTFLLILPLYASLREVGSPKSHNCYSIYVFLQFGPGLHYCCISLRQFLERQLFSELLTMFAGARTKKLTVSSTTVRTVWLEVYLGCKLRFALITLCSFFTGLRGEKTL